MRKVLFIVLCIVVSMCLYAESFVTTSFCYSMMKFTESAYVEGYSVSVIEKSTTMNVDLRASFFGKDSTLGFNIGLSILYPISSSANGIEYETEFFNCNWCPQIGLAVVYPVTNNLTMVTNAGYEMMFNINSEYSYDLGATVRSSLVVHGFFVNDTFIYKVNDKMNVNLGIGMYLPFTGTQKITATGYGSEKLKITYSGLAFEPFIGFSIKR